MGSVFDIDGTLLGVQELPGEAQERLLSSATIPRPLVFASSRPVADIVRLFYFVSEPYYILSNDGSLVYRVSPNAKPVLLKASSLVPLADVIGILKQERVPDPLPIIFLSDNDSETVLLPSGTTQMCGALKAITPERRYLSYSLKNMSTCDDLSTCNCRAISFFTSHTATNTATWWHRRLTQSKVISYLDTRMPGSAWDEVIPSNVNKCEGLKHLQQLGLFPQRFLALGNAWNDIELLRAATVSCVPADAEPAAKSVAHYISEADGGFMFCDWVLRIRDKFDDDILTQGRHSGA